MKKQLAQYRAWILGASLGLVLIGVVACSSSPDKPDENGQAAAATDSTLPDSAPTGDAAPPPPGGNDQIALDDGGKGGPKKSLYDRLGGKAFMTQFTDKFVEALKNEPSFSKNPKIAEAMKGDLSHFKKGLADYYCKVAQGGCEYKGKSMEEAHKGMGITDTDWKVMGSIFIRVLRDMGVGKNERIELANLTSMEKYHIINK